MSEWLYIEHWGAIPFWFLDESAYIMAEADGASYRAGL